MGLQSGEEGGQVSLFQKTSKLDLNQAWVTRGMGLCAILHPGRCVWMVHDPLLFLDSFSSKISM